MGRNVLETTRGEEHLCLLMDEAGIDRVFTARLRTISSFNTLTHSMGCTLSRLQFKVEETIAKSRFAPKLRVSPRFHNSPRVPESF